MLALGSFGEGWGLVSNVLATVNLRNTYMTDDERIAYALNEEIGRVEDAADAEMEAATRRVESFRAEATSVVASEMLTRLDAALGEAIR